MADHIPFVTSDDGIQLVAKFYSDSEFLRIALDRADKFVPRIPSGIKLWLDPCTDGMDNLSRRQGLEKQTTWFKCLNGFPNFQTIASPSYYSKPATADIAAFVKSVLDKCATYNPTWITVPQLPVVADTSRNKINRMMAAVAGKWKASSSFRGSLILPIVFTHQRQISGKTARTPKVIQAERTYIDAGADGFWVVDTDLNDESGSPTLMNKRFPAVLGIHEELNARINTTIRIAGPYWGLNLVLWAKDLIDYPAIGIGTGYRYFLSGSQPSTPSARLALPPLRRRAIADATLGKWLDHAIAYLAATHPAHAEFTRIRSKFDILSLNSREQVARFYKSWFDSIAAVPKTGRSMALFQDLSSAYALGKPLPELTDPVRRPEAVAQPLMLSCL